MATTDPRPTPQARLAAEALVVALALGLIAGTALLVVLAHRRLGPTPGPPPKRPAAVVAQVPPPPPLAPEPEPPHLPPITAPVDPTPGLVAAIDQRRDAERSASLAADDRASAFDRARRAAAGASASRKRRESIVLSQARRLEQRAGALEAEAEMMALERDVLGRRREQAMADLVRANARTSYAIYPYKGPNGTWRRPIPIECRAGMATIEPDGPAFDVMELSAGFGARTSPLSSALLRRVADIETQRAPDGLRVVPYVLFLVRPDGIRAYYEVRGRLEKLGIDFGYELVDQDWEIDYPSFDDPSIWSPGSRPAPALPGGRPAVAVGAGNGSEARGRGRPGSGRPGELVAEAVGLGEGGGLSDQTGERGGAGLGRGGTGASDRGRPGAQSPGAGLAAAPDPHPGFADPPPGGEGGNGARPRPADGTNPTLPPRGRVAAQRPGEGPATAVAASNSPGTPADPPTVQATPPGPLATIPDPRVQSWADQPTGPANRGARPGSGGRPNSPGTGTGGGGDGDPGPPRLPNFEPAAPRRESADRGTSNNRRSLGALSGMPEVPDFGLTPLAERLLEIVIACGPRGAVVQPGSYRVPRASLGDGRGQLVGTVQAVVRNRQAAEPGLALRPTIRFLVEPGGSDTYRRARAEVFRAGLEWPVSLQVADGDTPSLLGMERWR